MKKKELEILLERVEDIKESDVEREQYSTPATVASELLHFAFMNGDIEDHVVFDLGCGNGILGIGAKLLAAKEVVGIDSDGKVIEVANANSKRLGVEVEFRRCDVREVVGHGDTVVMNPPFGAQRRNRHADRIFLEKAFEIAPVVYSIHNVGSESFLRSFAPHVAIVRFPVAFPLKRRFWFHKKEKKFIEVDIYRMERKRG
ncbi:MAG: METTL5 family protein [Methanophagales archaeon]|nr:METTL5 family protein [Methanophagales archaeon]